MSDVVIRCEGLGKKYRIGASRHGRYVALRDVLTEQLRGWGRRLLGRAHGEANGAYEEIWALKDVSFEVRRGECVGIIGRNGAGKSTLLKLLSRITEPTEGRIRLRGRVASLLEVGTGFHPELTGRENIYLNGAILGMKRTEIRRKFDEIVAFAEVEKFIETPVKYYSSGMYMRLAFAVAAHLEPEILIVDEVLAVGDAGFQKKCLGKMGKVACEGRTVLFVSHNMVAIQALCYQALLFQEGRLIHSGKTREVIPRYMCCGKVGAAYIRNGSCSAPISLRSAEVEVSDGIAGPVMRVTAIIHSRDRNQVSVDIRLLDDSGGPIAFAAVGSFNPAQTVQLVPGTTCVMSEHDASMLASGMYNISIDIADPTVAYHDTAEMCLSFEVHVAPQNGCYRRMEQQWGFGSIELPYIRHCVTHTLPMDKDVSSPNA